jgi:aminoglycoside phosphotransferase (APT) family kinase protein
MASPTRRRLTLDEVAALVDGSLGHVVAGQELDGGGFAAVWRVGLDDGRTAVVKVAPPPGVRLLRYESGLLAAEAAYFRLVRRAAPDVPVPDVLAEGPDWLATAWLPGTPLAELRGRPEETAVRRQLGAAVARLHRVGGARFGYPGRRTDATWRGAFLGIVADLLADACELRVALPAPPDRIAALIERASPALDAVRTPVLVHFDLWDGNVLADAGRLTGLVDGERFLYGDPLVDFVSPALYGRIEEVPGHPFVAGYGGGVDFDAAARRRLSLYRAHLYLIMNVEPVTRGLDGPEHAARRDRLAALLDAELSDLAR